MKCPLNWPIEIKTGEGLELRGGNCMQADCAWYRQDAKECAVLSAARDLDYIEQHTREGGYYDHW